MNSKNETGSQLFARLLSTQQQSTQQQQQQQQQQSQKQNKILVPSQLNSNNLLTQKLQNDLMINKQLNLDSNILPNGIDNKSIVEIFSKPYCGKTELVLHFIARYLTPPCWKIDDQKKINLLNHSIYDLNNFSELQKCILVNTDSKVIILRLFSIMESRIMSELNAQLPNDTNEQLQKQLKKFIENSLKYLTIYECQNSEQFIYALAACEHFIQSNLIVNNQNYIVPIFIDSVNSYFEYIDRYQRNVGILDNTNDLTEKYTIYLVKKLCDRYNVCILATRRDYYFKNDNNYSYKNWQAILTKKIELNCLIKKSNNVVETGDDLLNEENEEVLSLEISNMDITEKKFQIKLIQQQEKNGVGQQCLLEKFFIIKNSGFELKN